MGRYGLQNKIFPVKFKAFKLYIIGEDQTAKEYLVLELEIFEVQRHTPAPPKH